MSRPPPNDLAGQFFMFNMAAGGAGKNEADGDRQTAAADRNAASGYGAPAHRSSTGTGSSNRGMTNADKHNIRGTRDVLRDQQLKRQQHVMQEESGRANTGAPNDDEFYGGEYHHHGGDVDDDDDDLLMTDAEKAQFAEQLAALEAAETNSFGGELNNRRPFHLKHKQHNQHFSNKHFSSGAGHDGYDDGDATQQQQGSETALYERTERWRGRVLAARRQLKSDLEQSRANECTFRPQITQYYQGQGRRGGGTEDLHDDDFDGGDAGADENGGGAAVHERLYTAELQRRQERKEEALLAKDAKEVAECTFKPRVVRSAWTQGITPRYLDPRSSSTTMQSNCSDGDDHHHYRSHSNCNRDEQFLFQPVVMHNSYYTGGGSGGGGTKSPTLNRYLSRPVHERLAGDADAKNQRARQLQQSHQYSDDHHGGGGGGGSRSLAASYLSGRGGGLVGAADVSAVSSAGEDTMMLQGDDEEAAGRPNNNSNDFFSRLKKDEERRENKKLRISAELESDRTFKPSLSGKSRIIVSKLRESGKKPGANHRSTTPKTTCEERELATACTFTPRINKKSAVVDIDAVSTSKHRKPIHDTSRKDALEAKHRRMKREKEDAELRELTFAPNISEESRKMKSGSKIAKAIQSKENFERFMLAQQLRKDRDAAEYRRAKAEQEEAELTFRPAINEAPEFVKNIASAMQHVGGGGGGHDERGAPPSAAASSANASGSVVRIRGGGGGHSHSRCDASVNLSRPLFKMTD